MKNLSFILIITVIFLCNCSPKHSNNNSSKLSKRQIRDSIASILISISDDWTFVSSTSSQSKVFMPEIDKISIRHWAKMNSNKPLNELDISGMSFNYIDSTNTMHGWDYDYEAKVEYRNEEYGLNVTIDSITEFIGIKELNNTSLIFTNGQKFVRIK